MVRAEQGQKSEPETPSSFSTWMQRLKNLVPPLLFSQTLQQATVLKGHNNVQLKAAHRIYDKSSELSMGILHKK